MTHEFKILQKETVKAKFEAVFRHGPGSTEKIHGQPFVVADLRAEIGNRYLPNTKRTLATRLHIWFPVSLKFVLCSCLLLNLPGLRFPSDFRYNFVCISCRFRECCLSCLTDTPLFASRILLAVEYRFPYMIRALNKAVCYDMNVLKLIALFSAFCR